MRRAAFYARVSSPHQAKEETIESQIEQLLAYAAQKQYDLPPGLRFMDKPGANDFLVRPGLDRLRDAAAAGAFQVLLCQNVDRIARNLGAQYVLLCELEQVGVEVIFLNEPNWGRDPQLKLLRNIQGAVAEYERILIQERMRRGRLYRLRHGQAVPTQAPYGYRFQPAALGQPSAWVAVPTQAPYGYRFQPAALGQPSAWVAVPEEAAIVPQLFAWYNEGSWSLGQLAQKLNAQGTPSPEGKAWSGTTLGRLLRQPAYKGIAYYNRRQTDRSGLGQQRRPGPGR